MNTNIDPYEALANAVVIQAAKDWRDSVGKLKNSRRNVAAKDVKKECEAFFKSPYFNIFTDLDGNVILKGLQAEVAK